MCGSALSRPRGDRPEVIEDVHALRVEGAVAVALTLALALAEGAVAIEHRAQFTGELLGLRRGDGEHVVAEPRGILPFLRPVVPRVEPLLRARGETVHVVALEPVEARTRIVAGDVGRRPGVRVGGRPPDPPPPDALAGVGDEPDRFEGAQVVAGRSAVGGEFRGEFGRHRGPAETQRAEQA